MKNFLFGLVFITLPFVAQASEARNDHFYVGARCGIVTLVTTSNSVTKLNSSESIVRVMPELWVEWMPWSWLGLEASGQLGNSAVKTKDYDFTSTNELSAPSVVAKFHYKRSWVNASLGGGWQFNQSSSGKFEQTRTESFDNYTLDPITFNLVYVGTTNVNVRDRYQMDGNKSTAIFQMDLDFPVWKGLSLGIDTKYTPWATSTLDLTKKETSYDGGPWVSTSSPSLGKVNLTRLLQLAVSFSYSF